MKIPTHLKTLGILLLAIPMAANAADLTSGYQRGSSSQLLTINGGSGATTFVDTAVTGGADLNFGSPANPGFVWSIDGTASWEVGDNVDFTGLAIALWSNSTTGTSNNTSNGTFTFSIYSAGPDGDWQGNNNLGSSDDSLIGTATATFTGGSISTYYVNFDTSVPWTADSSRVVVRAQSTGSIRFKLGNSDVPKENFSDGGLQGGQQSFSLAGNVRTTFSFQQGDLRKNGAPFGSGASYAGASDGTIIDQNPTKTPNSGIANRVGTQFESNSPSVNPNTGNDGRALNGLFTFDLTELADYIANNPVAVSEASLGITRLATGGGFGRGMTLYVTEPYDNDLANWGTSDGTNPWSAPTTQNGTSTPGAVGGGTVNAVVGGNNVGTHQAAPLVWGTSDNFVKAVKDALLRGDKKLYLVAQTNYGNADSYMNFAKFLHATVDERPELVISLDSSYPAARIDNGTTDEDTSITRLADGANSLLANDTPRDGAITEIQSSLSGGPIPVLASGATILTEKGATVMVNQNGTFEYDPTGAIELQALAAGESTADSFTYTMTDSAENASLPSLVAHWPLNDGTDGQAVSETGADDLIDDPNHGAKDATADGAGGTWVNDPTRGIVFSTTENDRLQAGTQDIDLSVGFSWSLWIKTTDTAGTIMGSRAGIWNRVTPTGYNRWADVGYNVADGNWHHMAVVGDLSGISLYIDGVLRGTDTTFFNNITVENTRLELGGTSQFSEDVEGLLSDVAVWKGTPLTPAQIQALYTGTDVADVVPVAEYKTATVTLDITGVNDAPQITVATTGEVTEDASLGATETTSSEADQAATLVAYYPLNDGIAGSTVTGADDVIDDPSHPAQDATVQGSGGTWVDDPTRGIVYASTKTDNLNAGTMGITGDFTWSMWVKTNSGGRILGTRAGGTWFGIGAAGVTGSWFNLNFSPNVNDNTWHHLALKRDGDTVSVWVDGVEKNSTTRTGANNSKLEIGGSSQFSEYQAGLISDVAIWEGALTPTQIQALAVGQKPTEIFSDVDLADTHTVTAAYKDGSASWDGGTLTTAQINAITAASTFTADAGGWAYEIENSAIQFIDEGETVTLDYDITVTDDSGEANDSDTQTVTITINGTKEITVESIVRNDVNPTNADTVSWIVTLDGEVSGLTDSNFTLTGTVGGYSVTGVQPEPGPTPSNAWIVTASNPSLGAACGTLGLVLDDATGTIPLISVEPLFTDGEVYDIDTVAPVISCAKQIVVTVPEGQSATVNYAPTAYDECEGVIPVVCDPPSGSSFGVGNHVVNCTATDSAGNVGMATFNVVVLVQQPVNSERTLEGVSVRGDAVAGIGPDAVILAINSAFLNNGGEVVFDASLQGNGANNSAVFFRPAGGTPAPVAVKGASFGAGAYGIFSNLSLNDAGDIGFQSLTSGNLPGHFTGPGAGPVANSARRLGASPSGGVYNGLYQPALASNGELLTPAALLLGNGGVTSTNDSVITSSAGTVLAREGSATGTGDLTHGQFLARVVASDSDGHYAFPSLVFGSTPAGGNAGIFVGSLGGGSPALAVRKGDAAAGTPGTFSSFLGESVNSSGEIALRAFAIGGGITAADNEGIWTNSGNTSAPPVLVAREGDVTPCIAGGLVAFDSFKTVYMGDDGSVCFLAYLKDSDAAPFAMVNASNDASIWLWRNGALDLIVREGDLANSTDGAVVGRIVDFDSNGDAAGGNGIAYSVEFAPISGDTTSRTNQAVYVDRGGEDLAPVLVLRRGDKFTVGEDEVDVLSLRISSAQAYTPSGSTGGFGRAINGDGDVLLNVGFTGSKSGIFVLGSPPVVVPD